jgi:16S rRNA (guanine966-N2)-methyltransferase
LNKAKSTTQAKRAQQVRIIGGQWKRTPLAVIDAEGLRPTPDRVRETVFNWLNHLLNENWQTQACLDLFAGSGALGFEAASRGAAQVTMVELQSTAWAQLENIRKKLHAEQVRLVRGDALSCTQNLLRSGQRFDLIFLDPPFHGDLLDKIVPICVDLLTPAGLLYIEAGLPLYNAQDEPLAAYLQGWQLIRGGHAGQVYFHILQRSNALENQA